MADEPSGLVVHALLSGQPLCGFTNALPKDWPKGHVWTDRRDLENISCSVCHQRAVEETKSSHVDDERLLFEVLSFQLYRAYAEANNWKDQSGNSMPKLWRDLSVNERNGWHAVAQDVLNTFRSGLSHEMLS